jgi:hemerythrin superfamily protein
MATQPDREVVEILLGQHAEIRNLLHQVEKGSDESSFAELVRLLAVHETAEEEVVYPSLRRSDPAVSSAIDLRVTEEQRAKADLADLEEMTVESPDFAAAFAFFRRAVELHAEAEEVSLFPALSGRDADELVRMGKLLRLAESVAPTHPHPNVPSSATANIVVGPFLAVADRVRDALRAGVA